MQDLPKPQRLSVRLLQNGDQGGDDHWRFEPGVTIEIGRASSNDVQLRDTLVSRLHARVRFDGQQWLCQSVGRNGVFHQEQRIQELPIHDGTVLRLAAGGPRLHFQLLGHDPEAGDDEPYHEAVAWIEGLATGDEAAAANLWDEYFQRVVQLAKKRIGTRTRRITDEEDVAVSVFESICAGMQAGRYPNLRDHESLWRLLCVMTKRKVLRYENRERRLKRGGGNVRGESVFGDDSNPFGLEGFDDVRDGFGQQLVEQTEWLFDTLGDDELRQITELKLAQYTNEEIAEELGCHVRTVKRRLQSIRSILSAAMLES